MLRIVVQTFGQAVNRLESQQGEIKVHMFRQMIGIVTTALLLAIVVLDQPTAHAKGPHCHDDPSAPPRGTVTHRRCTPAHRCDFERHVAPHAKLPYNHRWCGYYVGGGAAVGGCGRCVNEGTWGWDYVGAPFRRHVALSWWHGRKEQGGTGAYKTDGPHIIKHLRESHGSE